MEKKTLARAKVFLYMTVCFRTVEDAGPYKVTDNSAFCTLHSALSFPINFASTSLSVRLWVRGVTVV